MENLPESLYEDYHVPANRAAGADVSEGGAPTVLSLCRWIKDLEFPASRSSALQNLANNRGIYEDLARLLWSSCGTVSTLLQEVIGVYPQLSSPALTQRASTRVCNALLLFQCLASHPDTRKRFLKAVMPHYLYPFLNTRNRDKPHEYLRLGSLGVIAQLVKAEIVAATHFLLQSEAVPSCLHCIEIGSIPSKTVATFILHKILMADEGLKYCCVLAERYYAIDHVLKRVLDELSVLEKPPQELLQHVIACFLRLSMKCRPREAMRRYIPVKLVDNTFIKPLNDDPVATEYRRQLLQNLSTRGLD